MSLWWSGGTRPAPWTTATVPVGEASAATSQPPASDGDPSGVDDQVWCGAGDGSHAAGFERRCPRRPVAVAPRRPVAVARARATASRCRRWSSVSSYGVLHRHGVSSTVMSPQRSQITTVSKARGGELVALAPARWRRVLRSIREWNRSESRGPHVAPPGGNRHGPPGSRAGWEISVSQRRTDCSTHVQRRQLPAGYDPSFRMSHPGCMRHLQRRGLRLVVRA